MRSSPRVNTELVSGYSTRRVVALEVPGGCLEPRAGDNGCDMAKESPTRADIEMDAVLLERVIAEYREMPGLALTLPQAVRLWGFDERTCERLMSMLVDGGVLRRLRDGRFARAD